MRKIVDWYTNPSESFFIECGRVSQVIIFLVRIRITVKPLLTMEPLLQVFVGVFQLSERYLEKEK